MLSTLNGKKKIEIWSTYTTLEDEKKEAAVLLTLTGAVEEAVLELTTDDIKAKDGLKKVTDRLDKSYLKYTTLDRFQALKAFNLYQHQPNTPIHEHVH